LVLADVEGVLLGIKEGLGLLEPDVAVHVLDLLPKGSLADLDVESVSTHRRVDPDLGGGLDDLAKFGDGFDVLVHFVLLLLLLLSNHLSYYSC